MGVRLKPPESEFESKRQSHKATMMEVASSVAVTSFLQSRILTTVLLVGLILLLYCSDDSATEAPHGISQQGKESSSLHLRDGSSPSSEHGHTSTTPTAEHIDICSGEGIALLTEALRANPEMFGVRPYWAGRRAVADNVDNTIMPPPDRIYPGLDDFLLEQSFRGKRIFLFGDSTLYYLDQWIFRILASTNRTLVSNLSLMDMSAANNAIVSAAPEVTFNTITTDIVDDGTFVTGSFVVGLGRTCDLRRKYAKMKAKCLGAGCQIIIINFGFHWMHFHGAGRTLGGCEAIQWIKYEEFMESTLQLAISVGAKTILFKTCNFVCSAKFTDEYASAVTQYAAPNDVLLDKCFHDLRSEIPANIMDDDIRNYCFNATFDDKGSNHLNKRIETFVKNHRETLGIRVGIFNDHDVESCNYTSLSDGRHYPSLNLVRIRLLAHQLWCIEQNDGA